MPDLAVRTLGGSVIAASDESFAVKENLINPWEPGFTAHSFGAKGQEYDGWETARRRDGGHDWAIVRLGLPGVIDRVVIDTAWFKGNYPPHASVEACAADADPTDDTEWVEVVPRSPLKGDSTHEFEIAAERRFTHVRLTMFPDGGIARLRVHGRVVPDPALLSGLTVDVAALEHGARVVACSDEFYSSPEHMLHPGHARNQAEGWETARRRDGGHDWAVIALAAQATLALAEIDTTHLKFNAPAAITLSGATDPQGPWHTLLPRTPIRPDHRHRIRLDTTRPITHARLDIHPDGGIARLRLLGHLTPDGERTLAARYARSAT
ncbi:allantoicase [Spirillospora sp. CA-294931]|uniref:allantoicase n=1 Tax=Spirillospora sp. CA-294931 TaxID=3240042 RepID=UPI003D8CD7F6